MRIVYRDPSSNPKKRIYPKDVDISRVPRIFYGTGEGRGLHFYPRNDIELLRCLRKRCVYKYPQNDIELLCSLRKQTVNKYPQSNIELSRKQCFDKSTQLEIYHVGVKADKVTVEECLKLLRGIDCESGFIACSVEKPSLFFAELSEDDATRLKALDGISFICPRRRLLFTKH